MQAVTMRSLDEALDLLRGEAAKLRHALVRTDEEMWHAAAREAASNAARASARLASARLVTMTQTPYVAAIDAAAARPKLDPHSHPHLHPHQ